MTLRTEPLLDNPEPRHHFVQLYTDDRALARNVSRYLAAGVNNGEAGIVVATPEHCEAFRSTLRDRGIDVDTLEKGRKLLFLDAARTLSLFMVRGRPDWSRFEQTFTSATASLTRDGRAVRAYGEMVGLLWVAGEYSAAIRVEGFWNRILGSLGASLYCAYPIDVFSKEFEACGVHAILCDHTHMLPSDEAQTLDEALGRAMEQILGSNATIESMGDPKWPAEWGAIPSAERMILWLRENLPNSAPEILDVARVEYCNLTAAQQR